MDMPNPVPAARRSRSDEERVRIERFIRALNQSMAVNGLSQRALAARMGVESGTFTKYIKGLTDPLRIGSGIQAALAETLGVTLDSLISYYQTGQYLNPINMDAVESWIRSEASQEDLPELLQALMEAGDRWLKQRKTAPPAEEVDEEEVLTPYPWPRETIAALGLAPAALERLGLREDSLVSLETDELIDDALVEGFALVTGLDSAAVRQAFEQRLPVSESASQGSN